MCVGCRQRAERTELVRLVAVRHYDSWSVVVDSNGSQPGRGAHLHPTERCLRSAITRKAFGRALRIEGRLTTDALVQWWHERRDQET